MLTIRPEQLKVFQPVAEAAFAKRVVRHLRKQYAGLVVQIPGGTSTVGTLPDEVLLEMVENGIGRARGYGLSYETTLTSFVILMFAAAPNFDEHPLIRRVLTDEGAEPNSRLEQLATRTTAQNWLAVKQSYDAGAWNLKASE